LLTAPLLAFADDGPPSMIAIAVALRSGHPQDAEALTTRMMAAPNVTALDTAYLHLNRGLAREKLGRRNEAVTDFTAAIDAKILPPVELARALFDRGVTLDETGHASGAIADYSQAIAIAPRYAAAFNNRGNAYRRTKQFELARADYEAALNAGDDEPEFPLYGLGRIAEAHGDIVVAQDFYRKALAANAQYMPADRRMAALAPAAGTPATYSLHPPETDPSVQESAPSLAPTLPVRQVGASSTVELHSPPAPKVSATTAQRIPATPPSKVEPDFGLRPAILDTHRKAPVRTASLTPTHVDAVPASGVVQLGAWHDRADAAEGWNRMVSRADGLLSGLNPHIVSADIPGKGLFWRLRVAVGESTDARAFCEQLKAKGLACIVARN
jgi:Flp pilus assembly protein TadD